MSVTDWIALTQAIFLAAAALLAWLTFRSQALDRQREPLRRLIIEVGTDLKAYAQEPDNPRLRERLAVAVGLLPPGALSASLETTRGLIDELFRADEDVQEVFDSATAELSVALAELGVGQPPPRPWWRLPTRQRGSGG